MTSRVYPLFLMYVDTNDDSLVSWYKDRVEKHNEAVLNDPHPNSGFDLGAPEFTIVPTNSSSNTGGSTKLVLNIKGTMTELKDDLFSNEAYYMYPRSSLSKTPLMLSNHVGIIDAGYRGSLAGAFRNLGTIEYEIEKFERLLQICHSSLKPFLVKMVDTESELGATTRGEGGFGSTGR